jgi:hypothetical protein
MIRNVADNEHRKDRLIQIIKDYIMKKVTDA